MKYLKQKLMAAAAMVMVATVMLSSASYAWFTISTAPEVTNITTTVTANQNFEIALGTDKTTKPSETGTSDTNTNTKWGALVALGDTDKMTGLGPAKVGTDNSGKTVLQYATYGTDGRPSGMAGVTEPTSFTNGKASLTDANGNVIGQVLLFWVRTNTTGNITATLSGVKYGDDVKNANKVGVAMRLGDTGTLVEATMKGTVQTAGTESTEADGTGTVTSLGTLTASEEGTPLYVYIYLDGTQVNNADAAATVAGSTTTTAEVVIGNITFTNGGITAGNSYTPTSTN